MSSLSEKERIRSRYKGVSRDELETIPAIEQKDFFVDDSEKRVGVYARVSTGDPRQTSSFELQQNHYTDLIDRRPGWNLYKIYADEGISGTSLKHRDAFKQMIADCEQHKIDLIVTKSVSRFARNIYDCIGYVRELAALKPPIGVFFETENLYTLKGDSEMTLSFIATLAQEESHAKSSSMNLSYEMRFSRGIFLTPELLGYDKDEDGNLVINEDEALTVQLIFFMFLYGYGPQQIADTLMKLNRPTKKGNFKWSSSTVLAILQNERHCGDVLAHKTFTPNYLNHKSVKNNGEKAKYIQKDHHEAIISRDDFIAVQQIISFGMKGRAGMLPNLRVIDKGALSGFVIINPTWAGFTASDYYDAVSLVEKKAERESSTSLSCDKGTVDLRDYQIVRGEFFSGYRCCILNLTSTKLRFSLSCLEKLNYCRQIELLIDPLQKTLVVRPSTKDNRNSQKWLYFDGESYHPSKLSGRAYLPVLFEILGWDTNVSYSVRGECLGNGEDGILVFELKEAQIAVSNNTRKGTEDVSESQKSRSTEMAMPQEWISTFGPGYYESRAKDKRAEIGQWDSKYSGKPIPRNDGLQTSSEKELRTGIEKIITAIAEGGTNSERSVENMHG